MKLKSNVTIGGSSGMIGTEEQVRYALFKMFSEDYSFFHQHITEDIELHNNENIFLIQVKRNQKTSSDVAQAIKKYLEKPDFIKFILKNKDNIVSWEWVSNTNKMIDFKDVMNLILIKDITKNISTDKKIPKIVTILDKKLVEEFLELMLLKFKFIKAPWISSSTKASTKILNSIKCLYSNKGVWYAWKDRARDYLMNQITIFLAMNDINLESFLDIRNIFFDYSKKNILHDVANNKGVPLSNDSTYKKMYELFGTLEANMIILSNSDEFINSRIRNTGIEFADVIKLKKEIEVIDGNK